MSKILQGAYGPLTPTAVRPWRISAATALRTTGHALSRLARQLRRQPAAAPEPVLPRLEFYCEAGAPEGALYVDGQFVGHLPGVTRL